MWPSLELRWFCPAKPCAPRALFETLPTPETRIDRYAFPCHPGCGIKLRQGKLELKLRVADRGACGDGAVQGRLEQWEKWSLPWDHQDPPATDLLQTNGWLALEKKRYQQVYSVAGGRLMAPDAPGANSHFQVEWTELTLPDERWWTLGFEAWGVAEEVEADLRQVVKATLTRVRFECVPEPRFCCGYPHWLNLQQRLARRRDDVQL